MLVSEGRKKDIDFIEVVPADKREDEDKENGKDDDEEPELTITLDE